MFCSNQLILHVSIIVFGLHIDFRSRGDHGLENNGSQGENKDGRQCFHKGFTLFVCQKSFHYTESPFTIIGSVQEITVSLSLVVTF